MGNNSKFDDALQLITNIKLKDVEKQRLGFQKVAKALGDSVVPPQDDPIERVSTLVAALDSWPSSGHSPSDTEIVGQFTPEALRYWIAQAKRDPGFSPQVIQGWAQALENRIHATTTKLECAKLFGALITEWLESGDSVRMETYQRDDGNALPTEGFEVDEDSENHRERLKELMFDESPPFDPQPLTGYLDGLFSSDDASEVLATLRRRIKLHSERFESKETVVCAEQIGHTLSSLIGSSLLLAETKDALREFRNSPTLLEEVASIVRSRLRDLGGWNWPSEGLLVDMRRHESTGKLRAFTDPDIIDGIMLHYIGIFFQVKLKEIFRDIFGQSPAWKHGVPTCQQDFKEQLEAQIGAGGDSISEQRYTIQNKIFFFNRLASSGNQPNRYDDFLDAPRENPKENSNSTDNIKKVLLRTITTESQLHQALSNSFTILQTDLEAFGPTLQHQVILTVLKYFGMPKKWLVFFKRFLEAPLRLERDGNAETETRIRQRGTPTSYSLSILIGEVLMFVLDFAVNQKSQGLFLYRMHDDMWLWDSDANKCAVAWGEMQRGAGFLGIQFNESKSGSATVGERPTDALLPTGDVKWGFLKFCAEKARFIIDQETVDQNVAGMRKKLAGASSVFGWVSTYNKYMALFYKNFGGTPANCFGADHINEAIDTFARVQRDLLPGNDSAVGYLRKQLSYRFGIEGLPEGYFYLPVEYGGLGLYNPIPELVVVANAYGKELTSTFDANFGEATTPEAAFSTMIGKDANDYLSAKNAWARGPFELRQRFPEFISFQQFISLREGWLQTWGSLYFLMLQDKAPHGAHILIPRIVKAHLDDEMNNNRGRTVIQHTWLDEWNFAMYGHQLIKAFGGLKAVDPSLIPTGMVALFRNSRLNDKEVRNVGDASDGGPTTGWGRSPVRGGRGNGRARGRGGAGRGRGRGGSYPPLTTLPVLEVDWAAESR